MVVKRIFMVTMMVILSNASMCASQYYQSLSSAVSSVGQSIEDVNNVPLIGKLTNLLPVAVLAASLKECPMQTMAVLAVLSGYLVAQNSAVQEMADKYDVFSSMPWRKKNIHNDPCLDESIFVFDGYDNDDDNGVSKHNLLGDQKESKRESKPCSTPHIFL